MRFSLAIMYVAKVQTHVLEYPTQERFVHVSFHGSRDDDWLIGHDLVSEERKLLCLRRTCQGKEGIRERYAALIDEFQAQVEGSRFKKGKWGNTVRSFLIHNGVLLAQGMQGGGEAT